MAHVGEYLHCFKCSNSYQWMYNDACPHCKQDTEANLQEFYTHMQKVEAQYQEHLEELAESDECENDIFNGTSDYSRMGFND